MFGPYKGFYTPGLCLTCNQTPASNVCEVAPIYWSRAANGIMSTNYRKCVSNFPSTWLANWQWQFLLANHGTYSNPGTQAGYRTRIFALSRRRTCTRRLLLDVQRLSIYFSLLFFQEVRRSKGLCQECHSYPVQDDRRTSRSCKLLLRHV